jgi:hypothetical protein
LIIIKNDQIILIQIHVYPNFLLKNIVDW